MSDKPTIEFVNDWSELEEAIAILSDPTQLGEDIGEFDCAADHVAPDVIWAIWKIKDYVPRLLTQYASLLEMSYVLTDLMEKQHALAPKAGLYLPDHT